MVCSAARSGGGVCGAVVASSGRSTRLWRRACGGDMHMGVGRLGIDGCGRSGIRVTPTPISRNNVDVLIDVTVLVLFTTFLG